MLIISNFHDYYDGVGHSTGIDKSIVYQRKLNEDTENDLHLRGLNFVGYVRNSYTWQPKGCKDRCSLKIQQQPISFCGKFHMMWKSVIASDTGRELKTFYGTGHDEVISYVEDEYEINLKFLHSSKWNSWEPKNAVWSNQVDWDSLHRETKCPILTLRPFDRAEVRAYSKPIQDYGSSPFKVVKNPRLADWGFYREIDVYTAFQEISSFIGGVLGWEGRPMVQLADKDLIGKHGFDKLSFRKAPTKKA